MEKFKLLIYFDPLGTFGGMNLLFKSSFNIINCYSIFSFLNG